MPKTTKTTRKASTASGKKIGLKSRFSLRSKKVQFFVVIILVALLGGGYYVYKSSAAIATTSFSIGKGMTTAGTSPCLARNTDTEPSKNNMRIATLICPGKGTNYAAGATAVAYNKYAGKYRACFTVKGGGSLGGGMNIVGYNNLQSLPTFLSSQELAKINGSGYTPVCTAWVPANFPIRRINMAFQALDKRSTIATVSFITLEQEY